MTTRLVLLLPLLSIACRDPVLVDTAALADVDGDGVSAEDDCNDGDASVYPDAPELCDGVDNDCDEDIDEEATDASTFYVDGDGDGFGTDMSVVGCDQPAGYADQTGDCDDAESAVYPGAPETECTDPVDYNCDGSVGYADGDDDGFPACEDCDDAVATVNPLAAEVCDDVDNNCDGQVDEAGAVDEATWYADTDDDGFGDSASSVDGCEQPTGYVADDSDCDDDDAAVSPDAVELCNGIDDNCNGVLDDDATDMSTFYADSDGDGVGGAELSLEACEAPTGYVGSSDDCDDLEATTLPGATELCDGEDNDCDGSLPDSEADLDADGVSACDGDCDDDNAGASPDLPESCDGVDNDCDGMTDEADAIDPSTWYLDADGDGYGVSQTLDACDQPSGWTDNQDDCDDGEASIHPDAQELPGDGLDNDCVSGDLEPLVYGVDRWSGEVWAVNRVSGELVWTADIADQGIDVTVGPDGTIYAGSYTTGGVVAIDPSDQSVTTVVASGLPHLHGLHYEFATDKLIATVPPTRVVEIDPTTGDVTDLITTGTGLIDAIRMEGDDRIWLTDRNNGYFRVFDPASGAIEPIVKLPVGASLIVPSEDGGFYVSAPTAVFKVDVQRKRYEVVSSHTLSSHGSCPDPLGMDNVIIGDHTTSLWTLDTVTGDLEVLNDELGQTWGCAHDNPPDLDGDGYTNITLGGDDCDDLDPDVNPGATDSDADGVDQDCDFVDGIDADGDGSSPVSGGGTDCDDADADVFLGTTGCDAADSCEHILLEVPSASDGIYQIDPLGTGAFDVFCDMTLDGGGWTRVVNIVSNSFFHADEADAVGDVSDPDAAAKLSDEAINALSTAGYWRYDCSAKDVFVRNENNTWTSQRDNSESWSIDNNKDLTFECAANRAGYVFSDHPVCSAGHSNYAAASGPSEGNGCYHAGGGGWNQSGHLWAR